MNDTPTTNRGRKPFLTEEVKATREYLYKRQVEALDTIALANKHEGDMERGSRTALVREAVDLFLASHTRIGDTR